MIGRVLPVAKFVASKHEVHVLGFSESTEIDKVSFHNVGSEPFSRTTSGKERLTGVELVINMVKSVFAINLALWRLEPDMVIVFKTMPHNVLGVRLWNLFHTQKKVIIDVDDFELTANKLSSVLQRFSIHWAQRVSVKMADCLVAASPFLLDHFSFLRSNLPVHLIPTGITKPPTNITGTDSSELIFLGSTSISSGHRVDLLPEILELVRKDVPEVKLTIAGSGDDVELLKKQFEKRGLVDAVKWHGRFTSDQLPELLSQASIIIDPIDASISNRAKSSYRVSLAAAVGIPVVSSNIGIRSQLLPSQLHERFFAKSEDVADYAKKIVALLSNPISDEEKSLMREKAEDNSWEVLTEKYLNVIEQC